MKKYRHIIKNFIFLPCILISFQSGAQLPHIKVYFNHPVDTTVATGTNAIYLHGAMLDTLIAYINRAKYSIDIAQYDYIYETHTTGIAPAINNAYSRGVKIRWICDGSSPNTGLQYLDTGIYTLSSPTTSNYGIMHNKFAIFDAHSPIAGDPVIWTGSMDWNTDQVSLDYNNTIIFQDSALAQAYTAEFNIMWGDTGIAPDTVASEFGPYKPATTEHIFTIDGKTVELYFSPSDGTETHIINSINGANSEFYFGVYTFTEGNIASAIVQRQQDGVYVSGIMDEYSVSYNAYSILSAAMDSNLIIYDGGFSLYHSKYLIADPCNTASDPLVLTGSHNWSEAANTVNDENTVIVHDSTIANIYYQSFSKDFTTLGGVLSPCPSLPSGIADINGSAGIKIFPNPTSSLWLLNINDNLQNAWYELYDMDGKLISQSAITGTQTEINATLLEQGIYIIKIQSPNGPFEQKLVKL